MHDNYSLVCRDSNGESVVALLNIKLGICNETSTKVIVFRQEQFFSFSDVRATLGIYI